MKQKHLLLPAALGLLFSAPGHGIDLVLDTAVLGQASTTAANAAKQVAAQAKDYMLQAQMYQDMVKNTVAPVAWVWNEATQTYQTARSYSDMLQYYSNGGGVEGYLAGFQNAGYYSNSPCFSATGCTWAEIQKIRATEQAASAAQKRANDAQMRGVSLGQDQLQKDAASLVSVQSAAQAATGRNEMMGAANQLSSANANNLLAVRALMLQQQEAENARAATLANREAIQNAADNAALQGEFVKSPVLDYSKY
jgi:P-type conjugative transfer protein TrbJ